MSESPQASSAAVVPERGRRDLRTAKMVIWQDTIPFLPQNLLYHPENLVVIVTNTTQNNGQLRLSINVPIRVEYLFDLLLHLGMW